MSAPATLIPVRMLTQFAYCNRLGYLEWVQGEFQTSADVEEGKYQHRIVDAGSTTAGPDDTIHARSVSLSDDNLYCNEKVRDLAILKIVNEYPLRRSKYD